MDCSRNETTEEVKNEVKFHKIVIEQIVTVRGPNGTIEITKQFLTENFEYFRDYIELFGADNDIIVNEDILHVAELFEFLLNDIIPENKKKVLYLMNKWECDTHDVDNLLDGCLSNLKYIPNMRTDYFNPSIKKILHNYPMNSMYLSQIVKFPDHVLAMILKLSVIDDTNGIYLVNKIN